MKCIFLKFFFLNLAITSLTQSIFANTPAPITEAPQLVEPRVACEAQTGQGQVFRSPFRQGAYAVHWGGKTCCKCYYDPTDPNIDFKNDCLSEMKQNPAFSDCLSPGSDLKIEPVNKNYLYCGKDQFDPSLAPTPITDSSCTSRKYVWSQHGSWDKDASMMVGLTNWCVKNHPIGCDVSMSFTGCLAVNDLKTAKQKVTEMLIQAGPEGSGKISITANKYCGMDTADGTIVGKTPFVFDMTYYGKQPGSCEVNCDVKIPKCNVIDTYAACAGDPDGGKTLVCLSEESKKEHRMCCPVNRSNQYTTWNFIKVGSLAASCPMNDIDTCTPQIGNGCKPSVQTYKSCTYDGLPGRLKCVPEPNLIDVGRLKAIDIRM